MGVQDLHTRLLDDLRLLRRRDGGFSPSHGANSEAEPTAIASLALRDARSRTWIERRQRGDGGLAEPDGRADGPTTAALAALVMSDARAARRALRYAIAHRSLAPPGSADAERRPGWGWTSDARSTVEPTSRVLLAVNALTPSDQAPREEAIELLRARQCADGGWNYGNASVNDVDLRGYAQTTAVALMALQGGPASLVRPGLAFLRSSWRREPGGLTTAQAVVAFRLHGVEGDAAEAAAALEAIARRPSFAETPLTVAWAALATGPDALLDPLRSRA